ncbi:MAG TPA: hypothetical protein VF580_00595 [Thermoanaerobaculia bacterium]
MSPAALVLAVAAAATGAAEPFVVWSLRGGVVDPAAYDAPAAPVGSIQKVWVARAWAEAHPDPTVAIPRHACGSASGCWNRRGHGTLGLRRATSLSCNTYFLALAGDIPRAVAERTFREAGFELRGALTPERMVGLDTGGRPVKIRPGRLLDSFRAVVSEPWLSREDVRAELIGGMRDATEDGTGSLVPLPEVVVKTGTVASLDSAPLRTSGWAIAADPTGGTVRLALLRNGTGALTAARLAALWQEEENGIRPSSRGAARKHPKAGPDAKRRPLPATVRIRLFTALAPRRIVATNVGTFPLRAEPEPGTSEWVGPGASTEMKDGAHLSSGTWELSAEMYGLVRIVRGSLEGRDGRHPVLTTSLRDWVEGVIRSEARGLGADRLGEFVPVVLRFLQRGARHGREDVCDLSHCCLFSGFGPHIDWPRPDTAALEASPAPRSRPFVPETVLSEGEWALALESSARPGASLWSGHCGGRPLSEREVWGSGSAIAIPCERAARHARAAPWTRVVTDETLASLFHRKVLSVEAVERGGVRKTGITFPDGRQELLWDDLHQRLAQITGWDALPSPPDSWSRADSGWKAVGRGRGHRVGYCLGD